MACGRELAPNTRFCDQCGTPVGPTAPGVGEAHEAVRKTVTVLFCDLVGSTSFGERVDAESAREAMATYHAMVLEAIERCGGTLAKFIGDGAMALFGVPEVAEDDADRAVAAGLALQRGFEPIRVRVENRHDIGLGLRVGINTGEIVLADGDADLVGDPINTAARLEAACPPGDVLVGEETWRLTRSHVRYEVLGEVDVKGKDEPVAAFRVADDAIIDDERATPFVGRADEIARLRVAFDESVANRSVRLVTVIGAPGVGKTRISREFCDSVGDGVSVVELRCERSGTATFAPIADLLRSVAELDDLPDEDDILRRLRALVGNLDDAERVADLLASFVGATAPRSTEEAFLAVRRLIESIGRRGPLIIVVDDIQWAEPLFLDLLEHLAEWADDSAAMLIGLARPELRDLRPTLAEESRWLAAVIQLEGLDAAATAELAALLIGADSLPPELVERLPASTEGNPLFVRELMRMLVDDRVIEQSGQGWELAIDAEAVEVPPTIQSLLATRLERMPADERRLLELASVVGPEFALGAVAAIANGTGIDPPRLRPTLERLRRRELVEPTGTYWGDEPIYRFHHVLIRDASYRRVLKRTRAELHLRVGEWTARTASTSVGEHEVAIAHHFEQAHEYRRQLDDVDDEIAAIGHRAAELLRVAAERALDRDDLASAGSLAERALDRLDDTDDAVPDLLLMACESLLGLGDVTRGRPRVEQLLAIAVDDDRLSAWADCFVAQLAVLTEPGRLHEMERVVDTAAQRLAELGDEAGVAKARLVRAGALARLGRVGDCEAELDIALTAARSAGERRRVAAVLGAAPVAALWGPSPIPRAGGRCLDVIRLLRITTGSPAVEATSIRCQAVLEALRGRFDTARSMLADARATVEELGLRHALGETDLYAGIVELLAGDPIAAEVPLRRAYQSLGRLGVGADAGQAAAYLARSLLLQGRLDEADQFARDSDALAGQNPQTAIVARAAQAEILAARGMLDEAVARAVEAVELASGTDIVVDHANANAVLARISRLAGDEQLANRAAAAAADLYAQKAATIDVGLAPAHRSRTEPVPGVPAEARDGDHGDAQIRSGPLWTRAAKVADAAVAGLARHDLHDASSLAQVTVLDDRRRLTAGPDHPLPLGSGEQPCEVLAVRGEHLVLIRNAASASGADGSPETTLLAVLEFDEHDGLRRGVLFDDHDLRAAVAELDRVFLTGPLDPAVAITVAGWAQTFRLVSERDLDGYLATMTDEVDLVDHRQLGWGTSGTVGLRERSASLFELDGELVSFVRWFGPIETTAAQMVWSAHALVRPSGAHHVDDHLLVTAFDRASGLVAVIHQFGSDQLAEATGAFEEMRAAAPHELRNGAAVVARTVNTQARAGHIDLVRQWCSDELRVIGADGDTVLDGADGLADSAVAARAGFGVERVTVLAVRGDRLALVELSDDDIDHDAGRDRRHWLAVQESDEHGRLAFVTLFGADDAALRDAVDLLDDRWTQTDPSSSGQREAVTWKLARGFRHEDEAILRECLADECIMVDRRQLGWPTLSKAEWIDVVREGAGRRGVFVVSEIYRMDATGYAFDGVNLSMSAEGDPVEMIRQFGIGVVADGRVVHVEAFDPGERDAAMDRLDELTASPPIEVADEPWNEADRLARRLAPLFVDPTSEAWLEMLDQGIVAVDRRPLIGSTIVGRDAHRDAWKRGLGDRELTSTVESVAVRGDRLALHRWRVGVVDGGLSWEVLQITRWNNRDLLDHSVGFAGDDLAAAAAELDRLYLEEVDNSFVADTHRTFAQASDMLAVGDVDGYLMYNDPSFVMVDHRQIGWPELDLAGMRTRVESIVKMPGEVFILQERMLRLDPTLSACWAQRIVFSLQDGVEQVQRSVMVTMFDRDSGLMSRIEQFAEDRVDDALARFDELLGNRGEVLTNRASSRWGIAHLWRRHERHDLIAESFAGDAGYLDEVGETVDPFTVDHHRVIGVRGELLALVELRGTDADVAPLHRFAVEEIDERGDLRSITAFPTNKLGLIGAANLFEQRWAEEIGVNAPVVRAVAAWNRAHRALDTDEMYAWTHPDLLGVDHRPLGFPSLDRDALVSFIGGQNELEHGVVLSERIVSVTERGLVGRVGQWRFDVDDEVSLMIPSYCVVAVRDGVIDRFEFFPEDDPSPAIARLDELTRSAGFETDPSDGAR